MNKNTIFSNISIKEKVDAGNFPQIKIKILQAIEARSHAGLVDYLQYSNTASANSSTLDLLRARIKETKLKNLKYSRESENWKMIIARKIGNYNVSPVFPEDVSFTDINNISNWISLHIDQAKIVEIDRLRKAIKSGVVMDLVVPESRVSIEDIFNAAKNLDSNQQRMDETHVELSELESELSVLLVEERAKSAQLSYEIRVLFNQFLSMEPDGLIQPLYLNILKSNFEVWSRITVWRNTNSLNEFWSFLESNSTRQVKLNIFKIFANLYRYVPKDKTDFFEFNIQFDKRIRDLEPYKLEEWYPTEETKILFYWIAIQEAFGSNQGIKLFNQKYQLESPDTRRELPKSLDIFRKILVDELSAFYNRADFHLVSGTNANSQEAKITSRLVEQHTVPAGSSTKKNVHCTICDSTDHYCQFCKYIAEDKKAMVQEEFRAARARAKSDSTDIKGKKKPNSENKSGSSNAKSGPNSKKKVNFEKKSSKDKKVNNASVKSKSILDDDDFEMFELETSSSVYISRAEWVMDNEVQLDDGANNLLFNDRKFFNNLGKLKYPANVYGANKDEPTYVYTHGGSVGIFGNAFYDKGARSIIGQSAIERLGFDVKSFKENISVPTLTTSKVVSKGGHSIEFTLKNGIYLAPLHKLLQFKERVEIMSSYVTRGNPLGIVNSTDQSTPKMIEKAQQIKVEPFVESNQEQMDLEVDGEVDQGSAAVDSENNDSALQTQQQDEAVETAELKSVTNNELISPSNTSDMNLKSSHFLKSMFSPTLERTITQTELRKLEIIQNLHLSTHHSGPAAIKKLINGHLADCSITSRDVELWKELRASCKGCLVNLSMPPPQKYEIPTGAVIGTYWEADLFFFQSSIFLLLIELVTGFNWVCFPKNKSETALTPCAKSFLAMLKRDFPKAIGEKIYIHSDREKSFKVFESEVVGLTVDKAPTDGHAYRVESNGKIIKMKAKSAISFLQYSHPKRLIPRLITNVVDVRNAMLSGSDHLYTPNEQILGVKFSINDLTRVSYGQIGYVVVPENQRKSKDLPSVLVGIVVGFEPRTPKNLFIYIMSHNSVVSRAKFVATPNDVAAINALNELAVKDGIESMMDDIDDVIEFDEDFVVASFLHENSMRYLPELSDHMKHEVSNIMTPVNDYYSDVSLSLVNSSSVEINTDSMTGVQAIKTFGLPKYEESVLEDIKNFDLHGAIIYTKLESGIPLKSVSKAKFLDNGDLDILRTRFAALGNLQKQGTYYDIESYMISKPVLFMMLSLVRYLNADVFTSDIPAAYLNANLNDKKAVLFCRTDTDIIVKYKPELKKFVNSKGQLGGYAVKAVNGFKESGNRFMVHHRDVLISERYIPLVSEQNLYQRRDTDGFSAQLMHVDDLLAISTSDAHSRDIKSIYSKHYSKKKLMDWKHDEFKLLGMHIRVTDDKYVIVDIAAYTLKVLNRRCTADIINEFSKRRGMLTPSDSEFFIGWVDDERIYSDEELIEFLSCLMELMYMVIVRIDIVKECTFLAKRVKKPCARAWKCMRRLWAYLHENPYNPIKLGSDTADLTVYADAAYAVHDNGRSHTGIFVTLGENSGPIITKSYVQDLVTLSSSEGETSALVDGVVKKTLPLAKPLVELGIIPKINIRAYEDNTSTITIAEKGEGYTGKNRHFRVRHHVLREMIHDGNLVIKHCRSEEMIADYLTKCKGISASRFYYQIVRAMFQGDENGFKSEIENVKKRFIKM